MDVRVLCCCLLLVASGAVGGGGAATPGTTPLEAAPSGTGSPATPASAGAPAEPATSEDTTVTTAANGSSSPNETPTPAPTPTPTPTPTNETPTPTPTPTPTNETPTDGTPDQFASVGAFLRPPSPPADTAVDHTLTLEFGTQIENGTAVVFPGAYDRSRVSVQSVQVADGADGDGSISGRLTTSRNRTEPRPRVELTTTGAVRNVTVGFTARHPPVTNETRYELGVAGPASGTTPVVEYRVRPIGPDRRSALNGEFDRVEGTGFVYANATVYQGERDIAFRGALSESLRGVSSDATGVLLEPPIPADAATGRYSVDGENDTASIRVQQPKITTLRLENSGGADVTDGTVYKESTDTVTLIAQSNFETAENIELVVSNGDGLDITNELIDTSAVRTPTESGEPATASAQAAQAAQAAQTAQTAQTARSQATVQPDVTTDATTRSGSDAQPGATTAPQLDGVGATSAAGETDLEVRPRSDSAESGETVVYDIVVTNADDGIGTYDEITVTVAEAGAADITEISDATGAGADTRTVASDGSSATISARFGGDTNDTGTVTIATVTAQAGRSGETPDLEPSIDGDIYDELGLIYTIGNLDDGTRSDIVSGDRVRWQLDISELDTQTLSVVAAGSDDLDTGQARSAAQLAISRQSPSLSFSNASPNRGQRPTVTVSSGVYGAEYVVGVDANDLRNDVPVSEYHSVFRNVGTTSEIGVITRSGTRFTSGEKIDGDPAKIYARVRIDPDDGTGETQLETADLGERVGVELLERNASAAGLFEDASSADTGELRIGDPAISLSGPDGYVPGEETTLQGSADSGVDTVVLYARSNASSEFELVDLDGATDGELAGLSVSGSFSKDVELSTGDGSGNALLSFPGTYRVAALPESALLERRSALPETLSLPAVLAEAPDLHTLGVRRPATTVEKPGSNGRLAVTADTIEAEGTVSGRETALLVAIGERGSLSTRIVSGPEFDVDLPIGSFPEGRVTLFVVSSGRDGRIGDGSLSDARIASSDDPLAELESHLDAASTTSRTGDQLRAILRAETHLDTASDDPAASESFRLVPPNVEITSPQPDATFQGGTEITVTGRTTVPPRVAPLDVSVSGDVGTQEERRLSQWSNGTWETTIPTTNLTSGRHRLTARIGDVTATREIVIADGTASRTAQSETVGVSNAGPATPTADRQPIDVTPTPALSGSGSGSGSGSASGGNAAAVASTGSSGSTPESTTGQEPWRLGVLSVLGLVVGLAAVLAFRYRN